MKARCCTLALVLSALQVCLAQVPSGEVDIPVTNSSAGVYNFAGDYILTQALQLPNNSTLNLSFGITLAQDLRGRLTGSDITLFQLGANNQIVAGFYTASGTVSASGGATVVKLMVRGSGRDTLAGVLTPFNISARYSLSLVVNTNGAALTGKATGQANFSSLGTGKINDTISLPLSPVPDGTWTAQMTIVPLSQLKGTGVLVLANGARVQAKLTGTYHSDSGVSSVNLVGVNGSQGNTLHMDFSFDTNGAPVIEGLRGRLLGQTVQQ